MLNYTIRGPENGIPVVFLHAVGIDSWMWNKVLEQLPNVKAILIDLPGHGRSRTIPWKSLEDSAAAVCDIVKRTCPDGAHLAALSMGSYVGFYALHLQPAMFRSALLSGIHAGNMPRKWFMYLVSSNGMDWLLPQNLRLVC